jgi:hypothetical protein
LGQRHKMSVWESYEECVITDFPADNPPTGTVWRRRTPTGWAEKRSDGSVQLLCSQVEATRAPTIADLDAVWSEWWFYDWDMPNARATVWVWRRSPVSNDLFPPLNPIGQINLVLTPVDLPNGNKQIEMPQGATFEYTVTRTGGSINQFTFVAGTFSGASSYYMDAAKNPLRTGATGNTFTSTQTTAGLGISVNAPSNAVFVRYEFQYVAGGSLIYDFAI